MYSLQELKRADSTHKRIPLTKIIASIPVSSLKTS